MVLVPDTFSQITYQFTGTGLPNGAACTLGVHNIDALTPSAIGVLAKTGGAWTGIFTHVSSEISCTGILVKNGPTDTGPSAVTPVTQPGLDSDAAASCNTAVLIRKVTNQGGRHGRGRLFWPGIPQAKVNANGTVLAATLTTLTTEWAAYLTTLAGANLPPVLLHSDAESPTLLTGLVPDGRVATQRRRLRR